MLHKDPFMNTSLRNFVNMKTDRNFSCFLDTLLYKEKNRFRHSEKTESLSCAFHGALKVGLLRFQTARIHLLMGKRVGSNTQSHNSIRLIGTLRESENSTLGIFKPHLRSCKNVRFSFAQNSPGYTGSFCAISKMFGIEKLVNLRISRQDIKFQVHGKIYNRVYASMNCSSSLLPWEEQVFDIDGQFERNTKQTDFVATLEKELESYAKNTISQALRRKEAAHERVKHAHIRFKKVLSLKKDALDELQRLTDDYALAKEHLETAKGTLNSTEAEGRRYSKDVEGLKLDLGSQCKIQQCKEVCQEGIYCSTCYEYVTEKSKGMCPATCFRTEQQRIPPYSEVVYCNRPNCKRIHNTNGFFKMIFGKKFAGIAKFGLRMITKRVVSALGAPSPVAGAISDGLVTLVDTGRADEVACSIVRGAIVGAIGGKGVFAVRKEAARVGKQFMKKAVRTSIKRKAFAFFTRPLFKCQREQKDGHWKCNYNEKVKCNKGIYKYEYEHIPYECKKSCVIETITRTIEKQCCKNVACASFVVSTTCVVANAICKKARIDVLEKISKTKSHAKEMLKDLEYAKSNVSYWNMKMQKRHSRVLRQQRWVNMTLRSARSLEKTYNSTVESKKQLEKLLSKPLKIMSLFNEQLTSANEIKIKEIRFKTKVFPGSDNTLLPIVITVESNGSLWQTSTAFDFGKFNASLKSVAEEILVDISGNVFTGLRKKRSIDFYTSHVDALLFSLKKYNSYCTKFTNYHEVLYNVAQSLLNISLEHFLVQNALSQSYHSATNTTNLLNTLSKEGYYFHANGFEDDLELAEAFELQQEEIRQNYKSLNLTSKLLIYNWFVTVEDMFNSSRMNYECSGMSDCTMHMLDSLLQMFAVIEADGVDHAQQQIKNIGIQLEYLSNSTNTTVEEGLKISTEILSILEKIKEMEMVCAQSPNITKQPEPITEIGVGKVLVLNCEASGTALLYSWTFNGKTLEAKKTNVLTIKNTTVSNSGNYTCIVSNHIAREKSIPAVVFIHQPPIIIKEPVEYLVAVLAEDYSLQCEAEETSNNVSYQWWFNPVNATAPFSPLPNEIFPYINFSPMKTKHEGWYFCHVSNSYGQTMSRISFVKSLSFTLPVPTAVLSFSLDRQTENINLANSSVDASKFSDYDVFSSHIMKLILTGNNFSDSVYVENLRPIDCLSRKKKNESNGDVGICSWEFQYIGRNVTSNVSIDNDFTVNAGMVINASQELSTTVQRLTNATNNGSLSFPMANNIYFIRANSIAIQKYSLMCTRSQVLLQNDFKCGKTVCHLPEASCSKVG